jgi:hypothetical protein
MTAQELVNRLNTIIKENPKAAHKEVVLAQYDSVGNDDGVEKAYDVKENGLGVVVIS